MSICLLSGILAVLALAISMFSMGYSMANWHFSNAYVREKVMARLEEELRWRLQISKDMTETTNEMSESDTATMDK